MKLFKEIKRRVRNVVLAVAGKDPFPPLTELPIGGKQVRVETFAAERFISPIIDEFVKPETAMTMYRRGLAAEIGHALLDAGYLKEEIGQRPHELGLRGYTMRLTVRVVKTEEGTK